MSDGFSLCIPTFRRKDLLADLLHSISLQNKMSAYTAIEVVIADNDAEQSAREVIDAWRAKIPFAMRYLSVSERGMSNVRNALLTAAKYDNVVFIDDDQLVARDFLDSLIRSWTAKGRDCIAGQFALACTFEPGVDIRVARVVNRLLPTRFRGDSEELRHLSTCGVVIRKDFLQHNGILFDPEFNATSAEDTRISRELRKIGKIVSLPSVNVVERIGTNRGSAAYWRANAFYKGAAYMRAEFFGAPSIKQFVHVVAAIPAGIIYFLMCIFFVWDFTGRSEFYFQKSLRQIGKIAGFFGMVPRFYGGFQGRFSLGGRSSQPAKSGFLQTVKTWLVADPERKKLAKYLRDRVLWPVLNFIGIERQQWCRVVMNFEIQNFLRRMDSGSLSALEISGDFYSKVPFLSYRSIMFPALDITKNVLDEKFDVIIMDQVLEHVTEPKAALANARSMLNDSGVLIVTTPFLIRYHRDPVDCWRWTQTGLHLLMQDAGFLDKNVSVYSWGNKRAVVWNLYFFWPWIKWLHSLRNEGNFPLCVWGIAKNSCI
jgi:GT2 family glycosyltransferase